MLNLGGKSICAPAAQQNATLWRCEHCSSFVSIHSGFVVSEAWCPVCDTGQLELCGTFDSLVEHQSWDA